MAYVDLTKLRTAFSLGGVPSSVNTSNPSHYSYTDASNNEVDLFGTNLQYSLSDNKPVSGTITEIYVDRGNNDSALSEGDIHITGLGVDFSKFQTGIDYRSVLSGDDTFNLGTRGITISLWGDGDGVGAAENLVGGFDIITGMSSPDGQISGDFRTVLPGGTLFGGDDTLSLSVGYVFGDADVVNGTLFGGNDLIDIPAGGKAGYLIGDANRALDGNVTRGK